jgi:RNA polymerase sigma-70 factor (ECF subfamily)
MEAKLPMSPTMRNETRGAELPASLAGVVNESDVTDLSALIQRIAQGEREALGELYDATVARLFALARVILRNTADAEEVVCDVYTQVWQSAGQYSGDRGAALAWMLMICRSRALDRMRRNRVRLQSAAVEPSAGDDEPSPQPGPDERLDLIQHGTAVHRALEALSPVRRQLVLLAFFRGMSHLEISEECGLPIGTVKSHIRRALTTLREQLSEGGSDVSSSS